MDAPQIVKTNLTPAKLAGLALGLLAVMAIADAAGITNWVIYPYSSAKAKLSKKQA